MLSSLLLAGVLAFAPADGATAAPITVTALTDTPVVIQRGDCTVSVYADRIAVLPAGATKPIVLLFDSSASPNPAPPPTPKPDPPSVTYRGPLWAALVLPKNPTAKQAGWRTAPKIRTAFEAAATPEGAAFFTSHLEAEEAVSREDFRAALAKVPPPAVLWVDKDGRLIKTTSVKSEQTILDDLKAIRGF